jgi:hypothetical protein
MEASAAIARAAARGAVLAAQGAYTGGTLANRAIRRIGRSVRRTRDPGATTLTRWSNPFSLSLVAGAYSTALNPNLSYVQTSDLIAAYDQYKINFIDVWFVPRVDPGNSGTVNNSNVWLSLACDPTGQTTAPTWAQVTAFNNAAVTNLVAGKLYRYRFQPRATNTLAGGNYAVNNNDWLILSTLGSAVSHPSLLMNLFATNASSTQAIDYCLCFNFSVRGGR